MLMMNYCFHHPLLLARLGQMRKGVQHMEKDPDLLHHAWRSGSEVSFVDVSLEWNKRLTGIFKNCCNQIRCFPPHICIPSEVKMLQRLSCRKPHKTCRLTFIPKCMILTHREDMVGKALEQAGKNITSFTKPRLLSPFSFLTTNNVHIRNINFVEL